MEYTYGWVGSAINAWMDKESDVFHLAAIERDIVRKTAMIKAGKLPHYGPLDVMHEDDLVIGVTAFRAIQAGTRNEIDAGYILPEFNALAEKMLGKSFTMSHHSFAFLRVMQNKMRIPDRIAKSLSRGPMREAIEVSTERFTVARPGAEANALTCFRVMRLEEMPALA